MMATRSTEDNPATAGFARRRGKVSGTMPAQREHLRTDLLIEMAFTVGGNTSVGYARNLSLGGMFVETLEPAPFGASVTLHVPLPGFAELADVEAVVRWNDETGMGVQFGSMGARVTFALTELVSG